MVLAEKPLALLVTIADAPGTGEAAIHPADVHLTEDGRPASVLSVDPVHRVPKVQILVDNGIGMPAGSLGLLRQSVQGLLDALPPAIEVTLVTTAPQPRVLEKATTDRVRLREAVNRLTSDSAAGNFVESLYEAVERIEKDKEIDAAYTIVTVGTTSGDRDVRDADVQKIIQRIQARHTVVHAVILEKTNSMGGNQIDLAQDVTRMSNGRLEVINTPNSLATLLAGYGAEISRACGPGAAQVRIVFERPAGMSGRLGQVALGIRGKVVTALTLADAKS
jgi:hypothetical protein